MTNNFVENLQHQKTNIQITTFDKNYIFLNRTIKYLLNLLLIYLSVTLIIYNYQSLSINILILLICTISSVFFYVLDLIFPSCNY